MAAFTRAEEITIPKTPEDGVKWGWEPHETVTFKGKFTIGDIEASSSVTVVPNGGDGAPGISTTTSSSKTMLRMIAHWNLTDDQGRVAELSLRNIEMLEMNYFTPIMETIDEITKRGQVKDPLASSSGVNEPTFQS